MTVQEDPFTALDALLPWIVTAHLKDHVVVFADAFGYAADGILCLPFGCGNLPIAETTKRLIVAGIDRNCCENVWSYKTEICDKSGGKTSGNQVFAPHYPDGRLCPHPERLLATDPEEVIRLERRAFQIGLDKLRAVFAADAYRCGPLIQR